MKFKASPPSLPKLKLTPRRMRLIAASLAVIALGVAVFSTVASSMINADKLYRQFADQVKAVTGLEPALKGEARVTVFPQPRLHIERLELRNPDVNAHAPTLSVAEVVIGTGYAALLSGSATIDSITLVRPVMEIERTRERIIHWDWVKSEGMTLPAPGAELPALYVVDGKIVFYNEVTGRAINVERISAEAKSGGAAAPIAFDGQFNALSRAFSLQSSLGRATGDPVSLHIASGTDVDLAFNGTRGDTETALSANGDLAFAVQDLRALLEKKSEKGVPGPDPLPLAVKGQATITPSTLDMSGLTVESGGSKGSGNLRAGWNDHTPEWSADLAFSKLNLTPWLTLKLDALASDTPLSELSLADRNRETVLPKHVNLLLSLKADALTIGARDFTQGDMRAELSDGAITVHQLSLGMAGDTQVSLFGLISASSRDTRFEGQGEIRGENLKTFLSAYDTAAQRLPDESFGQFSANANVFISSEQLRLSEAQFTLGELNLRGGLVTYFEATPRIEAEVALNNTNLDYFRDIWRSSRTTDSDAFEFYASTGSDFSWLKRLGAVIDFKISFDGFRFLDRDGTTGSVRLYAKQNEIGLHGLYLAYPDNSSVDGTVKLDSTQDIPYLDLVVNATRYDSAYLDPAPEEASAPEEAPAQEAKPAAVPFIDVHNPEKRWSEQLINLGWMVGYNANADISIGTLKAANRVYNNLKFKGDLKDQSLTIKRLAFDRFGGNVETTGTLVGGKVPGFSMSFTIYNADIAALLSEITTLDGINGRASLNGYLTTSGIDFRAWMEQMDMKIVIAGRGVRVRGINLAGITDSVQASRSTADVVNGVANVINAGTTEYTVDGNINIKNGVARTPGIALRSGYTVGNLTGEIDLIPWQMGLNVFYQFPQLSQETVPTMSIDLTGPVESYTFRYDTASLEAYVAKRIVGK